MSDGVELDMTEVFALARTLDLRSVEVAVKAAVAVKDASITTRDLAQQLAPVDTGELRGSIRAAGSRLSRTVKARAPYSLYVEFGTSDTAPQPFLYPASDRGEEQLLKDLAELAGEDL